MEREFAGYTTTVLAHEAHRRGHGVCYVTPNDFLLSPDDRLHVHGRFLPKTKFKDRDDFFTALQKLKTRQIDMAEVDVLMLRSDPSLDAQTMPWAAEVGILFGREAAKRGVIVVNDADSLSKAINSVFPEIHGRGAGRDVDQPARGGHQLSLARTERDHSQTWQDRGSGVISSTQGQGDINQ